MATVDIIIPQVGEAVDEVTLIEWHKAVGEAFEEGDVLFLVDTDKAVVEIPAFAPGVLVEILVGDESTVMPLQVVGRMSTSDERAEADGLGAGGQTEKPPARAHGGGDPGSGRLSPPARQRTKASPRARTLAREVGVDADSLTGSGAGGMVTERDVRRAVGPVPPSEQDGDGTRRAIARRTTESKATVPHFYLEMEVDMSRVESLRSAPDGDPPPTITASVVHACAAALNGRPSVNVTYRGDRIQQRRDVAVAVSVATDHGLVNVTLPVLAGAGLTEVDRSIRDGAHRARSRRLHPDDLRAKSMVVSNLGMHGVDAFTAIIDVPDPMILAVGRVQPRPVVRSGEVAIRPIARLTLSVDHRVLDGADAAGFLGDVRTLLEEGSDA